MHQQLQFMMSGGVFTKEELGNTCIEMNHIVLDSCDPTEVVDPSKWGAITSTNDRFFVTETEA